MNKVMMSYLVFFVEFLGVKVCEGMVGGGDLLVYLEVEKRFFEDQQGIGYCYFFRFLWKYNLQDIFYFFLDYKLELYIWKEVKSFYFIIESD